MDDFDVSTPDEHLSLRFTLDGADITTRVWPDALLLDILRDLGHMAPKEGCGVGVCGACTVLVDDEPISACIYFAGCVDGVDVWTARGLAERFPDVADLLVAHEAMQCGICTPGQLTALCALRLAEPHADEPRIREYLNGNLCRCTGYGTILEAAKAVVGHG